MADEKIIEWVQRDLDADLSEAEKKMLNKHLAESVKDRENAEKLMEVSRQLSLLPKVDPPRDIVGDVLARIDQEERPERESSVRHRFGWPLAAKAMAAAVAIGFIGMYAWMNFQPAEKENGTLMGDSTPKEEVNVLMEKTDGPAPAEDSGAQVWSPDETYQAKWRQGTLVVTKADGTVQYERSFAPMDVRLQKIEWLTDQTLKVTILQDQKAPQSITIDVVKKEEVHH
ncbi:hypothetical protein H1R82_08205 [Thermoactinomyces intermedius]|uniref:Anti-sigma factor n=1 Tax=Thermoactinomyces intermedius TaxID=2024 RepID=A0A8I1A734_THEIN|nr:MULTISPECIES: hypothetical protein [Thermoactinomyces]MBA4547781.1 hypothetical protein [Thermoactinomyces intermedius]MBA4836608.1 hypothetical protein [Thermoactinomyces intermedius]MBH8593990.1 hypothetical protein [Thermoactinomyces intermedius]MBH8600038.1 hypothetical protein [Thermoactinomyces sp. CICC 23799]